MLASEIQYDEKESIRVYDAMIERFPKNIKAYINYYNFLKKIGRRDMLDALTIKMMKAIEDQSVPTDEWVEAHMIRADALVILKKEESAVDTLENLIQIIPPLPIPGLSYLKKLDQRKMKTEEDLENSNGAINFTYDTNNQDSNVRDKAAGSIDIVYIDSAKSVDIIAEEDEEEKGEIKINVVPTEDYNSKRANRFSLFDLSHSNTGKIGGRNVRPNSGSLFLSSPKMALRNSIFGTEMLKDTANSIRQTEIFHYDVESFSVSTDVKFLFDIGKICAEAGIQIENGIDSINDFIKIMNYYKEDMDLHTFKKMLCDSNLYLAKLQIHKRDYMGAEKQLRNIYFDAIELDSLKNDYYRNCLCPCHCQSLPKNREKI